MCLSIMALFHRAWHHLVSTTLWFVAGFSVLRLSNTQPWLHSTCSSTLPLMDTGVVFTYWLTWIMLQWTGQCKYLSQVLVYIIECASRSCMAWSCRISKKTLEKQTCSLLYDWFNHELLQSRKRDLNKELGSVWTQQWKWLFANKGKAAGVGGWKLLKGDFKGKGILAETFWQDSC